MCPAEDLLEKNAAVRRPLELLASGRGLSDNYYRLKGLPNGRRIHAAVWKDMPSVGMPPLSRPLNWRGPI